MDKPLSTKPEECRYSFFQHTQCEFFPCHKTAKPEDFNCLFCYCPLYALGDKCGGNFAYVGDGIKDCSGCLVPHGRGSYSYITKKFPELAELARKKDTRLALISNDELGLATKSSFSELQLCATNATNRINTDTLKKRLFFLEIIILKFNH